MKHSSGVGRAAGADGGGDGPGAAWEGPVGGGGAGEGTGPGGDALDGVAVIERTGGENGGERARESLPGLSYPGLHSAMRTQLILIPSHKSGAWCGLFNERCPCACTGVKGSGGSGFGMGPAPGHVCSLVLHPAICTQPLPTSKR